MPAYFDSSILLSILKNDDRAGVATELWSRYSERVSSLLLEAECRIVLRRTALEWKERLPRQWLAVREEALATCLTEVDLKPVDGEILEVIREEGGLAQCRALDALHVATALFFERSAESEFYFCSFDQRTVQVASRLGLKPLPL